MKYKDSLVNYKDTDPSGLDVVADFDYSDAPEWALPREWFINNQYELEFEEI